MTISLQYLNVTVTATNVDESISLYRDALGLGIQNDVSSGGFRWVTLSTTASPGWASCSPNPTPAGPRPTATRCRSCSPSTDDLDATFEKARASGAEVLQEPIDQPWGPRECAFRDPSGNMVRVSQAPATA